jgi:hypothetical protein
MENKYIRIGFDRSDNLGVAMPRMAEEEAWVLDEEVTKNPPCVDPSKACHVSRMVALDDFSADFLCLFLSELIKRRQKLSAKWFGNGLPLAADVPLTGIAHCSLLICYAIISAADCLSYPLEEQHRRGTGEGGAIYAVRQSGELRH